jgi:hypothetical protein
VNGSKHSIAVSLNLNDEKLIRSVVGLQEFEDRHLAEATPSLAAEPLYSFA